jgi:hypothetical protein
MDLLQGLMGGGPQRDEYQDFVNRYDRGAPYEGISDQEAMERYQRVAPHLSPDEYEMSAEEAFSRMSPRERQEFARLLSQQAQQQGMRFQDLDGDGVDDRMQQDPRYLAQVTGRMQRQQPGLMQQLLGGMMGGGGSMMGGGGYGQSSGNPLANPLAKAALAGIAAMAAKRMIGGGGGPLGGGGGGIRF